MVPLLPAAGWVAVSAPEIAQLKWTAKPVERGAVQPAGVAAPTTVAQEPRERH
jgi:hypothetical protein